MTISRGDAEQIERDREKRGAFLEAFVCVFNEVSIVLVEPMFFLTNSAINLVGGSTSDMNVVMLMDGCVEWSL